MTRIERDRIVRRLDEAEGYLMLDLPGRALEILGRRTEWPGLQFEASYLTGEALRALGRHREALRPLEHAASLRPDDVAVALSLGWCYKRTHRLAQAIDALQRAGREHPDEPLLRYNLACYWSLAGNPAQAVEALRAALELDPSLRGRLAEEADFDPIRALPAFARLVGGRPSQV
jgi:tetratricopeptide (TPR) repeat protein